MTDMRFRYTPGRHYLVVSADRAILLPTETPTELIEELWLLIERGGHLVDVMNRLVTFGLDAIPDLAVLDGSRILLRGRAAADWGSGRTGAADALTWREWALPEHDIEVTLEEAAEPVLLPVISGVVRAGVVVGTLSSQGGPTDPQAGQEPVPDPRPHPLLPVLQMPEAPATPAVQQDVAQAGGSLPVDRTASDLAEPAESLERVPSARYSDATLSLSDGEPGESLSHVGTDTSVAVDADEDEDSYDRLFGATAYVGTGASGDHPAHAHLTVDSGDEPAAAKSLVDLEHPQTQSPQEGEIPAPTDVIETSSDRPPDESHGTMISSVPLGGIPHDRAAKTLLVPAAPGSDPRQASAAGSLLPPQRPSTQADPQHESGTTVEDDSGLTVSREALASLRASPPPGVRVPAVTCPAGHLNPPEHVTCRVCGIEVPDQPAVTSNRPDLGALVLETRVDGVPENIPLTGSLIIGRRPHVDNVGDGVPRLVQIPSPDKDLSRNHLKVSIEGWHVVVCDLGSTNGTVVQLPGDEPQRLHESRPVVISPGTRVELADVVTYVYQVAR